MFNNNRKIKRWVRELVDYIECESGYKIPAMAREAVQKELAASIRLNGQVSQKYLNNLIKAYKFAAALRMGETAAPQQAAESQVNNM